MTNATIKNAIKEVLEKWNFPVISEKEQSILFRYQLNYIHANEAGSESSPAVALVLTGFFHADNEREKSLSLQACNELNYTMLQTKLYIDSDGDLVVSGEFFWHPGDDMEYQLDKNLEGMVVAKRRFMIEYEKLEAEAKHLSDLAGQQ